MGWMTRVRPEMLRNDVISCLGVKSDNEKANKESPSGNAEGDFQAWNQLQRRNRRQGPAVREG